MSVLGGEGIFTVNNDVDLRYMVRENLLRTVLCLGYILREIIRSRQICA